MSEISEAEILDETYDVSAGGQDVSEFLPAEMHDLVPAVPDPHSQPAANLEWRVEQIQRALKNTLRPGVDYGQIIGKNGKPISDKPTLLKPGAEFLLRMFNFEVRFDIDKDLSTIDLANGVCDIIIKGQAFSDGQLVAESLAGASARESKWSRSMCPECGERIWYNGPPPDGQRDDRPDWKRKLADEGKVYTCADKSCGWAGVSKPAAGFNPDQFNTIIKMTEKRAKVALALTATGASHFFTQDIEDKGTPAATGHREPEPASPDRTPASGPLVHQYEHGSQAEVDGVTVPVIAWQDSGRWKTNPQPLRIFALRINGEQIMGDPWPEMCPYCLSEVELKEVKKNDGGTFDRWTCKQYKSCVAGRRREKDSQGAPVAVSSSDGWWGWNAPTFQDVFAPDGRLDDLWNKWQGTGPTRIEGDPDKVPDVPLLAPGEWDGPPDEAPF